MPVRKGRRNDSPTSCRPSRTRPVGLRPFLKLTDDVSAKTLRHLPAIRPSSRKQCLVETSVTFVMSRWDRNIWPISLALQDGQPVATPTHHWQLEHDVTEQGRGLRFGPSRRSPPVCLRFGQASDAGGPSGSRTRLAGFADLRITALPTDHRGQSTDRAGDPATPIV